MKRVLILVEGQTEEQFVNTVLQDEFQPLNAYLQPVIVKTKRTKSGNTFKGGVTRYSKIQNDVKRLLQDSSATVVTTLFDYYGLPPDFLGLSSLPQGNCYERVNYLMQKFRDDFNDPRFLPFLVLHEFETFLFADVGAITAQFPELDLSPPLSQIRDSFNTIEEINNGDTTHPSARIQNLVKRYNKVLHGTLIVNRIGLLKICQCCQHFNQWIVKLKDLL